MSLTCIVIVSVQNLNIESDFSKKKCARLMERSNIPLQVCRSTASVMSDEDTFSTPPRGPPLYLETMTRAVDPQFTSVAQSNAASLIRDMMVSSVKRVDEINQRLVQMGYEEFEQPFSCPSHLMNFEISKRYWRSPWIDATCYAKKMESLVNDYERTKKALDVKILELKDKNLSPEDIPDYTFKDEINGTVYKTTINDYYEGHRLATNNLTIFLEKSHPVNGKMIFDEKNKLTDEKLTLLLEMRRMQLDLLLRDNDRT